MSQASTAPIDTVEAEHPEFKAAAPDWALISDCLAGSRAVKQQGEKYLPPCHAVETDIQRRRYAARKKRAVFYNVAKRTAEGLVGEVTRKAPELELPAALEALQNDIDGAGVPMAQQAACALRMLLAKGRCGLLADYPRTDGGTSLREKEERGIRPTVQLYAPESIINWRTKRLGSETVFSLVVLREDIVQESGEFASDIETSYRVLRLSEEGTYTVQVYTGTKNGDGHEAGEIETPVGADKKPLTRIPFVILGSEDNSPSVDPPPLLDICEINIAHYRNSASHEDIIFYSGEPTLKVTGVSQTWKENNGAIEMGSGTAVVLPVGADMGFVQIQVETAAKDGMEDKKQDMISLGARIISQRGVVKTATEAGIEDRSDTSVLSTIAKNTSAGYREILKFAHAFESPEALDEDAIIFELNTDFQIYTLSAQEQQATIASWQGGAIDFEELRSVYKRAGMAFKDDDEVRANNEAELPNVGQDEEETE